MVWGRDGQKAQKFAMHEGLSEWNFEVAKDLNQLIAECNLIVTTTASSEPLLFAHQLKPGTHITAMGADDIGKQELDESVFLRADRVVVDSKSQCSLFGDTSSALKKGFIRLDRLVELGEVIVDPSLGRTSEEQITVCDLTGVAIQDLQIAQSIYESEVLEKEF
jgi:ornithine cyclodeaminase